MTMWDAIWQVLSDWGPGFFISIITGIFAVLITAWILWKTRKKAVKKYLHDTFKESIELALAPIQNRLNRHRTELDNLADKLEAKFAAHEAKLAAQDQKILALEKGSGRLEKSIDQLNETIDKIYNILIEKG